MGYKIQRKFTRWGLDYEAMLKLSGAKEAVSCRLRNISLKGVEVESAQELMRDEPNRVTFFLNDVVSVSAEAWVMWHKFAGGIHSYGLYFTRINSVDKEKLYEFVARHCADQVRRNMYRDTLEPASDPAAINDRRDFERFPMDLSLAYSSSPAQEKGLGRINDISANGLGLISDKPLEPNATLDVEIGLNNQPQSICVKAMVVWSKSSEPDKYRAGMRLDKAHFMELGRLLRSSAAA